MTMLRGNQKGAIAAVDLRKRRTILFVAALLLAGALHTLDRGLVTRLLSEDVAPVSGSLAFGSTALFVMNLAIYFGLLLGWLQSVRQRLLRSRARTYVLLTGALMLFFLIQRAAKYRLTDRNALMDHFFWYAYYIPLAMIPALFLLTCLSMEPETRGRARMRRAVWIVSVALSLTVAANDLHHWMFRPVGDILPNGRWTGYVNGPFWYVFYGCIIVFFLAGLVLLIRADRRRHSRRRMIPALLLLLLLPLQSMTEAFLRRIGFAGYAPFMYPEMFIFMTVGIYESCIRSRLIPSNEQYEHFFSRMCLAADITDSSLTPIYVTSRPVQANKARRKSALGAPLLLDEDSRLYGKPLSAGYAFWTGDESTLRRMNEDLADAAEVLETENELLQYENEQKEARARVDARNRVYTKAAAEVYGTQKKISGLLADMAPDAPDYRAKLARVLMLTAYVKRKFNFVLLSSERESVSAEELSLALEESARFLALCGVNASVERKADRAFSHQEASALYDSFQALAEALIGRTCDLMISLTNDVLRLMAECDSAFPLPDTPANLSAAWEDGQLYLTLRAEKGGAA